MEDDISDITATYFRHPPGLGTSIEKSFSSGFDGLFGCGASMITLVIVIIILLAILFVVGKWFVTFLKDISSTLAAIKEAINAKRD